jgi:hypothetical protein
MVDANDAGDCDPCLRTFWFPISPAGQTASVQPREMIHLTPGEPLDELFSPCCRVFYCLFDFAL